MSIDQYSTWTNAPQEFAQPAQTPREVTVSLDDVEEISDKRWRMGFWVKGLIALVALCAAGVFVGLPVALIMSTSSDSEITTTSTTSTTTTETTSTSSTTTSSTTSTTSSTTTSTTTSDTTSTTTSSTTSETTSSTTSTTTTTETTTTETTTTVAVNCVSPYALAPGNICVNLLIDFNNCGSVGYVCGVNDVSCSAGVCSGAPGVQLTSGSFIWTAAINGSVDDSYFGLALPFSITLYTTTTNYVDVTTNGVLCLGGCSSTYTETALPTSAFAGATALPYWDDLYIYSGTSQGIYYASEGIAPNRTLIFEYYMSHYGASNEYYHYQVVFYENLPGVVKYIYYDSSDGGSTCTIGVQGSGSGPFMQYSFDQPNSVSQSMTLTFDTNLGTITPGTIASG